MSRSGVKGTALESIVLDVNRLVEDGTIKLDALEERVKPQDMDILESRIQASLWYPLDTFGRLSDLLLESEGNGDPAYLYERGRRAADRIGRTGIYTQLSGNLSATYGDRVGNVMVTLGPAMYRDIVCKHETLLAADGPERIGFRIEMHGPVPFPEACRHSTLGFISFVAERTIEGDYAFTSTQPEPNALVFEGRLRSS